MRRNLAVLALAAFASAALAADTPKGTWIKVKCAVCHGEDGAGNTPEGKRRKVPDLRSKAIQKYSDAELFDMISLGHGKMPAFRMQLKKDQVSMLVIYIRSIAAK